MKLLSCYVSSFGNLKDFTYDFTEGLNTVKQDNGWGKSTFASFIKAMFYGLNDSKRTIEENERKRFAPWNSTEKFGGNLTFLWKGQKFKIERFFGNKESEDTVKLYDLATNKVFTEGKAVEDIGKRVFSIDEEGYLSTTYFSQKDFEIKSNTSITAKYNEIYEIQDTDAFDGALNKLELKIKELKSRGDKGKIAELKRSISAVNDSIERTKLSVQTIGELEKQLDTVKAEREELDKNIKQLTVKLENASKKEAEKERDKRRAAINAELKEISDKKSRALRLLNGKTVSENQIEYAEKCIANLREIGARKRTLKADVADFAPVKSAETKPNTSLYVLAAVFGAIAVLGAVLAVFGYIWALSATGAGVIAGIFALAKILSARSKTLRERESGNKLAEIYERKMRDLRECEDGEKELISGLDAFFGGFEFFAELSYEQKAVALKDAIKIIKECERVLDKLNAELAELNKFVICADTNETESVSELNEKLKVATEWYKQKVTETERIKTRIDALDLAQDSLIDAENRRDELKGQLVESERQLKILTLTMEYMLKADETLKTRYRAPLSESLNKYVKMIAGEKVSVSIDTDMKVSVNAGGAERETEFFSKGYRNLFEICKRFALTDILFTAEKPFIVLDDPFYNLDDEKLKESISLIKKLSEEYQILYLVCHESRRA
ncbi:MAG: hypothetical protein IJQ07_06255 [Clostridia bacterium]|nr:hypothetical protein [Clostridia bacterium]